MLLRISLLILPPIITGANPGGAIIFVPFPAFRTPPGGINVGKLPSAGNDTAFAFGSNMLAIEGNYDGFEVERGNYGP